MAKMGRPKSDNPKLNTLSVRVTDCELQKMREYADSHGITIAKLLHTGAELLLRTPEEELRNLLSREKGQMR